MRSHFHPSGSVPVEVQRAYQELISGKVADEGFARHIIPRQGRLITNNEDMERFLPNSSQMLRETLPRATLMMYAVHDFATSPFKTGFGRDETLEYHVFAFRKGPTDDRVYVDLFEGYMGVIPCDTDRYAGRIGFAKRKKPEGREIKLMDGIYVESNDGSLIF